MLQALSTGILASGSFWTSLSPRSLTLDDSSLLLPLLYLEAPLSGSCTGRGAAGHRLHCYAAWHQGLLEQTFHVSRLRMKKCDPYRHFADIDINIKVVSIEDVL